MRKADIDLKDVSTAPLATAEQLGLLTDPFAFARRLDSAIWVYDIENCRILYANSAACHLWQAASEAELCERNLGEGMSTTVAKRLLQYQSDFEKSDAKFSEMWTLYPDGNPTSVMVVYRGFPLPDGRMAMQCEVAEKTQQEPENLRSAEALLHTDVMITLYEKDGAPFYLNPAARNAAFDNHQTIARKFVDQADYNILSTALDEVGEHRMVAKVSTVSGHRWYDISAKLCSDSVTGRPAILVTEIDVSELKNARDKARFLADRDQLTGCYNRSYLQHHMSMLARFQTERCALLCFDVDRFKQINDRFGHEMGDVVLKEIAARVNLATRANDIIVRLGGDEFVVVFEDIPNDKEFEVIINRLLKAISEPIEYEGTRINATVSMGISTFVPRKIDFTDVLREADIALYGSKQAGRNRVTFFDEEMGKKAEARSLIEVELKRAVENREFELFFQPRVCLKNNTVISAEALVRWHHPERGIVMPGEFIPVCEETGLIENLGQQIVEMGCEQAIIWHENGWDLGISINISPRQFQDERLMETLRSFSEGPNFPKNKIELEITESVLIGNHDHIEEKLAAISRMGYQIAIDDFGTGYSNLSYISRFALNCLKIDQSFVDQLPRSGPIMSLIITLAEQIGACVVAEGVETQAQMDWLSAHGCNQVQGYFISKPIPIEDFQRALLDGRFLWANTPSVKAVSLN